MIDVDRVRACLYGGAIGDSLGLRAEYKPAAEVGAMYPDGGPRTFEAVDRDVFGYREVWAPGQWSDDTDHALCVLDAYLEDPDAPFDQMAGAFARNLLAWKERNPRGMGRHTRNVLEAPGYAGDPLRVAEAVWAEKPPPVPANGGGMRTSVVGLLRPYDVLWTISAAETFCRATHPGPECVASSVAVSVAVSRLVTGQGCLRAVQAAGACADEYDPSFRSWMGKDVPELRLDEGLPVTPGVPVLVGHTYRTAGAGFYALLTASRLRVLRTSARERFRACLESVIRAGGDTDTNGAVAGAMVGAYEGMDGIPEVLAQGLNPRAELDLRLAKLLATYPRQ